MTAQRMTVERMTAGPMTAQRKTVAGVLLAAGAGSRMGGPKALVEFAGEPLVRRGIRLLVESGCDPVVVVVGAAAAQVRPLCAGAEVVEAAAWDTGMAASLRSGLTWLEPMEHVRGAVVALVDQPLVTAAAIERLRAAHAGGAVAAVATYAGRARNPVLLDRSTWAGVSAAATGDEGARTWLRAHPDLAVQVDCSDVGAPDDVDTPQQLAKLDLSITNEGAR